MLTLTLTMPATRRRSGLGTFYANTAFLSSAGDDGTAVLGYESQPYATLEGALIALLAEHPSEEITVRVLDDGNSASVSLTDLGHNGVGYLILRGHGGVKTMTGTIDATGVAGDPPSNGYSNVALWDIELAAFDGSGGDNNGADGDGGNGSDVYLINDALVTSFTSDGGALAGGGANGAAGRERIVAMGMDGEPERNMDGTFAVLMS